MPKIVEKKMAEVCDLMGRTCSGPITFYLNMETGHIGIRIAKRLNEAASNYGMEDLLSSPEYAEVDEQITMVDSIPNRVILQCPIETGITDPTMSIFNVDVDSINPIFLDKERLAKDKDDQEFPIQKDFHARHIIYTFKFPNAKDFAEDIRKALVLAVLFEGAGGEEQTPPEGEMPPEAVGTEMPSLPGIEPVTQAGPGPEAVPPPGPPTA